MCVSSVALALPTEFQVSGSPVTSAGTLTGTWKVAAQKLFLATPNGASGVPSLRTIQASDLPGGMGSVTSVGLTMPAVFTVAGTPVTAAGTLAVTLATQTRNFVWAGPVSGAPATPTFRALVAADIPGLDASIIISGVFPTSLIPFLDASWITTGVFSPTLIPSLSYISASEEDAITAQGTTQATAYQLIATNNRITSINPITGQGVKLPNYVGAIVSVCNDDVGLGFLKIYPPVGASIAPGIAVNTPVTVSPGGPSIFFRVSPSQWCQR